MRADHLTARSEGKRQLRGRRVLCLAAPTGGQVSVTPSPFAVAVQPSGASAMAVLPSPLTDWCRLVPMSSEN